MPPLLSICIPAYNGAKYLRVTLEALLPQALRTGGDVEVVVIDDASTDDTPDVVRAARRHGPVRYVRNVSNLGSARNIVNGPMQHATGEFVCVWSQHCLMYPDALQPLLNVLDRKRHLNAFTINFRCARYPEDWPEQAVGGYDGPYRYLANSDVQSRDVGRWEELLDARTAVGTQSYAHIVRRSLWIDYWNVRLAEADFTSVFTSALTTYPHACVVATAMFGQPTYYVGAPVLTIFNGAQWWGSFPTRARAYLRGYPELIYIYRRLGWSGRKLKEAQAWGSLQAGKIMTELFRDWRPAEGRILITYLRKYWRYRGVLKALWNAFIESECCWTARFLPRCGATLNAIYRYCFCNCRPARWARAHFPKGAALKRL